MTKIRCFNCNFFDFQNFYEKQIRFHTKTQRNRGYEVFSLCSLFLRALCEKTSLQRCFVVFVVSLCEIVLI
jgi:hypothetical protein